MPRPFVFQIRIIIRKNAKPVLSVTKGRKVSENNYCESFITGLPDVLRERILFFWIRGIAAKDVRFPNLE